MTVWMLLLGMMNYPAACQIIRGEKIFGEDLAKTLPIFSSISRDAIIGYSPPPGARRTFALPELARIGAKYKITVPPETQACFEWEMRPLTEDAVAAAIREALHAPQAQVDVLAMSKSSAPEGKVVFPQNSISTAGPADPATPVMWNGYILYADSRKFNVWARVKVSATMTRVVAVEPIPADKAIEARQVRLEAYDDFPLQNAIARNLGEVVGRVSRRPLRAGLPVHLTDLSEPLQVHRGDLVQVTVISGAAQIDLEARAETAGRQGDVISLRNLRSDKTFRARVEGKRKAILIAGTATLRLRVE
jgi:flagella basal body P-ring formation protein FlgA